MVIDSKGLFGLAGKLPLTLITRAENPQEFAGGLALHFDIVAAEHRTQRADRFRRGGGIALGDRFRGQLRPQIWVILGPLRAHVEAAAELFGNGGPRHSAARNSAAWAIRREFARGDPRHFLGMTLKGVRGQKTETNGSETAG